MNYSYNGAQFPFQWHNSNPYITNGFSGNQHPAARPQQGTTGPAQHPPLHGPPPSYPVPAIPATQGLPSNMGLMYPFAMSGAVYPNTNPNPSAPFDVNWNYNYNSSLGCFPNFQQQQNFLSSSANSASNSVVTGQCYKRYKCFEG